MTKAELVEKIYEQVGFSKQESVQMVENVFEIIKECLEHGEKIKISGFGNFVIRSKRERVGRNPHTGDSINHGTQGPHLQAQPDFEEGC
jgi:integration host factor subunit alpha